ncbi:hypothetical protein [Kitasatospora camelliae]|uniref:Uncharacterized protein n=1 Tax=Kitasatospora camelliae TaxID=3156397 RepID=A0AAU8K5X2_9ACTN
MLTDGECDDLLIPGEGPLFPTLWPAYLTRMWGLEGPDGRRLAAWFGTDATAAEAAWDGYLWGASEFRLPLDGGHTLRVSSLEIPTEWGTEVTLHHPDWSPRLLNLATFDRYLAQRLGTPERQSGPGLSWTELTHLARTPDRAAPGVHDPRARLLLLLPALGDADTPADAPEVIGTALAAAGVPTPDATDAARFLLERPIWPAARWTPPAVPEPRRRLPWHRLPWSRPAAGRSVPGLVRCDAAASPRAAADLTAHLAPRQVERLARALGSLPPAAPVES